MASYVKYDCFVYDLGRAKHDLDAGNDTVMLLLSNTAPNNATHTVYGEATPITETNGYNAADIAQNWTQAANITTLSCETANNEVKWTASGGSFGPFRYVCMYNNDATPDDENNAALIAYWDYGSSIQCNDGESFTWDSTGTVANIT